MREMIYDTETTRWPSKKIPWSDPKQAELIQLAVIYRVDQRVAAQFCFFGSVECAEVPPEAFNVHGITAEMANAHGMSVASLVGAFNFFASRSERIIAHNLEFDWNVMLAAGGRAGMDLTPAPDLDRFCTMINSAPYNDGKWAKLDKLHETLCGAKPELSHHAMADAISCLHVYDEMMRREEMPT